MDKVERELPSGLFVAETPPTPPPPEPEPVARCCHCSKPCSVPMPIFGWSTEDGFHAHWPTCKHGKYLECTECDKKMLGCPVCGSNEEYT